MTQSQQPYQEPNEPSGKPPIVRLPQWVNIVLVLILLASCGADRLSAGSVADEVVQRLGSTGMGEPHVSGLASQEDVIDLCRLLGAIAAREKVSPAGVMSPETTTHCRDVAQEAATRGAP